MAFLQEIIRKQCTAFLPGDWIQRSLDPSHENSFTGITKNFVIVPDVNTDGIKLPLETGNRELTTAAKKAVQRLHQQCFSTKNG